MRLRTLVLREIFERKSQLLTSFLAILLGITVIVSIKNISHYSEMAVAREMDSLGANVLVLPKSSTLQDYYAADMQGETIPEEYVTTLAMSDLAGLDNISPKLSVPIDLQGKTFTLTGILPKSEFQAKAAWGGAGVFSRPIGCGAASVGMMGSEDKKTLARKRVIETLEDNEVLVGADVAAKLGVKDADKLDVLGKSFNVTAVLPQTGTVDDSRIFAHLHVVQDLSKKGAGHQCHRSGRLLPGDFQGARREDQPPIARSKGRDNHADCRRADQNQPHDVESLAYVPGDYHLRRRSEHCQLHVRECLRAAAGNRNPHGSGRQFRPGAADIPVQGPDTRRRWRHRRICHRHHPRGDARPEIGRRRRAAHAHVGVVGRRHFGRPCLGGQLLSGPASGPA